MRCRFELKWHKFSLSHHKPASFGTTQWQDVQNISIPFVLYRLAVFAYFWGFFIYDLLEDYTQHSIRFYMIYLTNWTYLSALADIALQLISALAAAYRCNKGIKPMVPEWLYKMHWVIVNISHTIAPLVTVMYWAGVFPFLDDPVTYPDIHLHALTTLYTLSDLFIHGTPRRYHHVIYPMCFGLTYLLFSIICGGLDPSRNTGIYPILDWADVGMSSGTSVVACTAVLALHGMTWGMVKLRLRFHGRWLGRKVSVEAGFDANGAGGGGGSGGGGGDGGGGGGMDRVADTGDVANGERDVYVDVDIGDGGTVDKAPANGTSTRRPVDVEKAFDNATLVVEEDGEHS